jgi:hypothetical protein
MNLKKNRWIDRFLILGALLQFSYAHSQIRSPRRVQAPSDLYPTIQQALDAVADGGSVIIRPGVYFETLVVRKHVSIIGAGMGGDSRTEIAGLRPTEIVLPNRARGLVNYNPGAGGEIRSLMLRGGDAGIMGVAVDNIRPGAILIQEVAIANSGRGILGNFSALTVKDTKIGDTLWNGSSILSGKTKFFDCDIIGTKGAGIAIWNGVSSESIEIADCNIIGNGGPGISVIGGAQDVWIHNCAINANREAGIKLVNVAAATIESCSASLTFPTADGFQGEGLGIYHCGAVTLLDSGLEYNSFGIINFASSIFFGGNFLYANLISLDAESDSGFDPMVDDLGGNLCYEIIDGQATQIACQWKSTSDIQPPVAPP